MVCSGATREEFTIGLADKGVPCTGMTADAPGKLYGLAEAPLAKNASTPTEERTPLPGVMFCGRSVITSRMAPVSSGSVGGTATKADFVESV